MAYPISFILNQFYFRLANNRLYLPSVKFDSAIPMTIMNMINPSTRLIIDVMQ